MVTNFIGIDLNTGGHTVVVADPSSGKVWKLGNNAGHTYLKYRRMEKNFRKQGKKELAENIARRREHILKDLAHKISRKVVDIATETSSGIKLEKMGRRNHLEALIDFGNLDSKYFHWLLDMIEYKAERVGIPVIYIDADKTSKICSRCGELGKRSRKSHKRFRCPACGHLDHADANAAFNIALREGETIRPK